MTAASVFSTTRCELGEGPLWHPERGELFWFDILGRRMYARAPAGQERSWGFDGHVSAAGWLDADTLLVAGEHALFTFALATGLTETVTPLEAETDGTRSNDGRADPWGGFWIGTMGKALEPGAGAIYRYWRGELRLLVRGLTIPNAICFSPDGRFAFYTDTPTRQILRQPLAESTGWPDGEAEVAVDLRAAQSNPDGAVTDAEGYLWVALWGSSCVARYIPESGSEVDRISFPARQISCPAFGGPGMTTLFATSAGEGVPNEAEAGRLFETPSGVTGRRENRVVL